MLKDLVKNNYKTAFISNMIFMLFLTNLSTLNVNYLVTFEFIYSFAMYYGLFIIAIDSVKRYKIVGTHLLITIFFIPPNILPDYKGLLFPVTYLSFIAYIGFIISNHLFIKWKKDQLS